jgi:hypothetical protein
VYITDGGKPAYVLLSIEEHQRLTGGFRKIADALAMPDANDVAFEPQRGVINSRPADFS